MRRPSANPIAYLAGRVVCETVIQLAASTALALLFLRIRGWHPYTGRDTSERRTLPVVSTRDGRQEGFLPSLVPLVLLYTAIMPLWLQLILGVWYDGSSSPRPDTAASVFPSIDLPSLVPLVLLPVATQAQQTINEALDLWQGVDRVWAGTRILSGMSAAFGLRVLLPTRPWETTAIVMAGWGAAGAAGRAWDILWEKLVSL